MKKIKRIPTLIGILLLVLSIGAGVALLSRGSGWVLKASPEKSPKQVSVTNITADGLTISWLTGEPTAGLVKYGTGNNLELTAGSEDGQRKKTVHFVTLSGLKPATVYQFKIIADGKLFDQAGKPFQTTTAPSINTPTPPSDIAYGKVVDADNQPVAGAVVYLTLANVSPLSTQTKSAGTWMIPLNLARSTDLGSFAAYDKEASVEEIMVLAENSQGTTVITATGHDSPVPDIILGQNIDLRETEAVVHTDENSEPETDEITETFLNESGFENPAPDEQAGRETVVDFLISNPEPGETVYTGQPLIIGVGPAGKELEIIVESDEPQEGLITTDVNGQWQWSPATPLSPGEHTVSVSFTDENGQTHSLSRNFVVLAANEEALPALSASPSGETVTPTPTPTLEPTGTPALSPTPASRASVPSTESGVPESGQMTPTVVVGMAGMLLLCLGIFTSRLAERRSFKQEK